MDVFTDIGFEMREELMVSPNGCAAEPTKRLAHFLKPCTNSIEGPVFELPSHCLSSVPTVFEPEKWPLVVKFHGWMSPQRKWKTWVSKMAALHESTWKKAGIHEAILSSTYKIKRNTDLVLGLAEKWCPETKSFIFPWGEATVTLEDVMISGYSVLGSPVFSTLETVELKEVEEKLKRMRHECTRTGARKADHYAWLKKFMDSGSEIEHEAFIVLWLSRFVFPHSNGLIVKSVFPIAVHLARGTRIALAPAILASIYRDLSFLKEKIVALTELISCDDQDGELKIKICSPFQLVQVWAWERFVTLRPNPNLIKNGEPRVAQWQKLMISLENVRTALDSTQECFDWRPYVKTINNWKLPMFYGEKEMTVPVGADLSEELLSLARCLRVSELVGIDCIEQYLPHRVAMQFGLDQDLPACVARANESPYRAWYVYSKPISFADLYVPSRHYEAVVTTQYWKWWKQSLLGLQSESDGALPRKRILTSSEIAPKRSKQVKKTSFSGSWRKPEIAKEMKGCTALSRSKVTAKSSKKAKERKFIARTKITPKGLDRMNDLDGTIICPNLTGKENSPLKQKRRGTDAYVPVRFTFKRAKKSVQTSEVKKEEDSDSSASEFPSKMLPLKLVIMKEADNSLVPPGFPPKANVVQARDSAKDDNLATTESLTLSKKQKDFQKTTVGDGENSSYQSQIFPSLIADNEDVKISEPLTEFAEKVMQNELANGGSKNLCEDGTESGRSCLGHDMSKSGGSNVEDKNHASMLPDKLEAWVSRLERTVAELKVSRFGHKRPL